MTNKTQLHVFGLEGGGTSLFWSHSGKKSKIFLELEIGNFFSNIKHFFWKILQHKSQFLLLHTKMLNVKS